MMRPPLAPPGPKSGGGGRAPPRLQSLCNDIRFISLGYIVFELSACENSVEFPVESGCKANDLTRYKVDTARRVLPYI